MTSHSWVRPGIALAFTIGLLGLAACPVPQSKVKVNCDPNDEEKAIKCEVTHESGAKSAEACWDLVYECETGDPVKVTNTCQVVPPQGKETKTIPYADAKGMETCKRKSKKLENLKVTLK